MANGYSSDSARRELSNEYQDDRVKMIFIIFFYFVHQKKVTSAADRLTIIAPPQQAFSPTRAGDHIDFFNSLLAGCATRYTK